MAPVGGVVDISSDEEDFCVGNKLALDPLDWASELFDVDDDAAGDDFDDLMVMSEWSSPPVLQKTALAKPDDLVIMSELSSPPVLQKKTMPGGGDDEQDDDDCVVLDGDPDKVVTVAEEEGSAGDDSSDELQIVAEKGQLACRDFPHSRHLCSNLPFSSTLHIKYCNMCHCFVCDAPAPCNYWGDGTSVTDHCHATDKEGNWKTLRQQAFKCKSPTAPGPEKHQDFLYTTMTSSRKQMQPMQYEIEVAQSLLSSVSNIGHPSLVNQSSLLNEVSQNQQRHPSVRVSLSVAGNVITPRAGRDTSNAQFAPNIQSRSVFKRAGAISPRVTNTNANPFGSVAAPVNSRMNQALAHVSQPVQFAPKTNAFTGTGQNNPPQRSFSAPIAFQAQQGQSAAYCQTLSNGMDVIRPQLSRCTSFTPQGTQCLQEPVIDVCTKSWEDILACVASDLGVLDYDISTAESEHAPINSGPVLSSANQGLSLQEAIAATENLTSPHMHPTHTTSDNVQADGPLQTIKDLHHLNSQSSLVSDEAHLNNFASPHADGLPLEDARSKMSRLEFEFDWD